MKEYEKDNIKVVWEMTKCKHAAECVKGSPTVFNPNKKPWIQTEHATKEEIMATVAKCPSGALTIKEA